MTADAFSHPDAGRLRAFTAGTLDDDDDVDRVAEHIDRCDACRAAVEGLLADNRFLGRLRLATTVAGPPAEDETERRKAVRALRREFEHLRRPELGGADTEGTPPQQVGDYVIVREVGRGGMGVVYEARHSELRRSVALKMILAGDFASETQRQRFRREAELAARVHHPNIVQVYEVGLHDGHPYLAMEWVDGGTLADRIDGDPWPPQSAAGLLETLARAIDAAHKRGVVHRDLKPSNILMQRDGGEPLGQLAGTTPKIADFGLARATDSERALTSTGMTLGTPEYMAPELAAGAEAGPAADVYALGAVLYLLLTGRPPFRGDTPMEVLEAAARTEPVAPRRVRPRLERDLETIALKAIEKEPARRYGTAGAMAEDLRRFLAGEPILASPPTARERLVKWARRRPSVAALTAALAAVTVVAFTGITALWVDAATARDRVTAAALEARQRGEAERHAHEETRAIADIAQRRGDAERRARYRVAVAAAAGALELNNIDAAREFLDDAPEEHRDWEWRHVAAQLDNALGACRSTDGPISVFALSPLGERIAFAVAGGREVRVRALGAQSDVAVLRGHQAEVVSIAFAPDGSLVAAGAADRTARVWSVADGRPAALLSGDTDEFSTLLFAPDSSRLAAVSHDRKARLWDLKSGRRLAAFSGLATPFSPDGRRVASIGKAQAHLRDANTGAVLRDLALPRQGFASAAFSPDGRHVATGSSHPTSAVSIWDLDQGGPPVVLSGHKNNVLALAFSPDGRTLASMSSDRTARLWDTSTARAIAVLYGHQNDVVRGAFSSDGRRLVTASLDRTARIWDTAEGTLLGVIRSRAAGASHPQISPDASVVALTDENGAVNFWDVDLATRRGLLRGHTSYVYDVAVSPDGRSIASAAWDGTVRLWSAADGRALAVFRHSESYLSGVAFSPDGLRCASIGRERLIRLWDVATGRPAWSYQLSPRSDAVDYRVAFHPRGDTLAATRGLEPLVQILDSATGKPVATLAGHDSGINDVIFSPDGTRLVSADSAGSVQFWTTEGYLSLGAFRAHDQHIFRLALSPSGSILATASKDRTVRLWDAFTRRHVATLRHGTPVYGVAFNPDGTRLAAACGDGTVRLWDVATFGEVAELRGHGDYVHAVVFSPDGNRLVSASGDYTVRVWNALPPPLRARVAEAPLRMNGGNR